VERPGTAEEIAAHARRGSPRAPGRWRDQARLGRLGPAPEIEISTCGLDALVEHNEGDLTAVLQAGLPLARAQETFAKKGQRLCLDPPDGGGLATVGGVVATGDSGPLRHRFGAARDMISAYAWRSQTAPSPAPGPR